MIELHPQQGKAFLSDAKVTVCAAGIQSGKTTTGSLWFRRQSSKWKGKDNNFIIGAPTYKILNQSTLPTFLKTMEGAGEYKKGDQEFHIRNGGVVYIRTATDPDSIEGIQNVRAAWLDEAGKCKYAFWVNFEGRCARTNAPIICTTTPYARNWVYTDLIRPTERKERDDVLYLKWRSLDNPSFSKEFYERQKLILDPVRFAMKYEGEHARRFGLVFEIPEGQILDPMPIPSDAVVYGGIDWGFTDPFVVVIRATTKEGMDIQIKEFYERGVFPDDIPKIVEQLQQTYKVKLFLADPSDPGKIAMLQRKGLPVQPADNDIRAGIDAHIKAIRTGRYGIFRNCKYSIDEYETYHWPDEEDEGIDAEDKPVDENNHCFDGSSLVHTTKGKIPIRDLVGKEGFVYSRDGRIERFHSVKETRRNTEILHIEFSDGKKLSVTPDHLILLKSGSWAEARLLSKNDRIQSGTHEGSDYFRDQAKFWWKSFYQISRRALLQGLFHQGEAAISTPGCLVLSSWSDFEGLPRASSGRQHESQSTEQSRAPTRLEALEQAFDGLSSETKENVLEKSALGSGEMAWVRRGKSVAPVTWQENDGEKASHRKNLRSLLSKIYHPSTRFVRSLLRSKLQNESTTKTIARITRGFAETTYNLEVENAHCLIVDGVVAHNSMDANRYISLYLEKSGFYEQQKPKIIDSERIRSSRLEYTHVPAWKRKSSKSKSYGEL